MTAAAVGSKVMTMSEMNPLDTFACDPGVRRLATAVLARHKWIVHVPETEAVARQYFGLKPEQGSQIAVYVNRNFVDLALDDDEAPPAAARLGAGVKKKSPTSYVSLREAQLPLDRDLDHVLEVVDRAHARNRNRHPGDGPGRRYESTDTSSCPYCYVRLPVNGRCDCHD